MPKACLYFSLLLLVSCAAPTAEPLSSNPTTADQVRRLSSILDYIAADYPGCVAAGKITNQEEYAEQIAFLADANELAAGLPPAAGPMQLGQSLAQLEAAIRNIAEPNGVAQAARKLSKQLLSEYAVVLAPAAPPSHERGKQLYAIHCASCHGTTGAGDGTAAAQLKGPAPRSFRDADIMADMSPVRAFNTVTDGIADTAMASYGSLAPSDRWSLAFYVFTFYHGSANIDNGRAHHKSFRSTVAASASRLAGLTDRELAAQIAGPHSQDILGYLRAAAPYESSGAPMDQARKLIATAQAAYTRGDGTAARRAASAAYLEGFEPHEASLRATDSALMHRLEREFLGIRVAMQKAASKRDIEQRSLRIVAMLDSADEALSGDSGASVAFFSAMAILLREGLEGALLVLLLLGVARKAGYDQADTRAVHVGWATALALGVVTWFASALLINALSGAGRELIEGVIALIASGVLLMASHFVLVRIDVQRRISALKNHLKDAVTSPRRRVILASLAFVAVYREAFETVLFLRAIMLDASGSGKAVALGAIAGVALLVVVVFAMSKLGRRLKPGPMLSALGVLLCVLAVVLAGKGIRSLQEAGRVDISAINGPRIDWLGVYPTVQGVTAQAVVLAIFVVIAAVSVWRRGAEGGTPAPSGA